MSEQSTEETERTTDAVAVESDQVLESGTPQEPDVHASEVTEAHPPVEADTSDEGRDGDDGPDAADNDNDNENDEVDEDDEDEDDDDNDEASSQDAPGGGGRRGGRRSQLEKEGEVAADFLETLLDICDIDGDIDVDIDGDRAAIAIVDSEDGRVPRRLVGPEGQVLEALQELTRLAVQSETGERSRLMLDVANHRAERRATLVTIAKEAIAEVRSSGEAKSLTPMTAFERKVVHDEVLAAGLVSESEGSEPRRYVVIAPTA